MSSRYTRSDPRYVNYEAVTPADSTSAAAHSNDRDFGTSRRQLYLRLSQLREDAEGGHADVFLQCTSPQLDRSSTVLMRRIVRCWRKLTYIFAASVGQLVKNGQYLFPPLCH
jgi:hypothetical protein